LEGLVAALALITSPGAWAETYSNHDSKYPESFCDDIFGTLDNGK
jgi:hypothetical protein